ncbi:MAG: phage holin family protein [Acidobacteria bacterium]|nr:phage holin family protein [Acidobacteriota bacterium]
MTGPIPERSVRSIFEGVVDNVRDILRAELALARHELNDDVVRGRSAAMLIAAGAGAALVGLHLLLWCAVYALSLVLPLWAAAGSVGLVFTIAGGLAAVRGVRQWRSITFGPERTVATMKENVQWLSRSIN